MKLGLRGPLNDMRYTLDSEVKKLHSLLTKKGINSFLPMSRVKQYSDRKKWTKEPLLNSYVFVQVNQDRYFDVLNTTRAVGYVCFEGKAAPIPDNQITALYNLVYNRPHDLEIESGKLVPGELIEVIRGPLKGVEGELRQVRGNRRLLIRFDTLGFGVHTEVGLQDLKLVRERVGVA